MVDESHDPTAQAEPTTEPEEANNTDRSQRADERTFTQEQIDEIFRKRLRQAKAKWDAEAKAEADKAAMSESERLRVDKAEAEQRATAREEAANQRAIKSEAGLIAAQLGIRPDRIKHAIRLAELAAVQVDDDGEPDTAAIRAALEQVLGDVPELKTDSRAPRSGGQFNGQSSNGPSLEEFEQFTDRQHAELYQRDRATWERLQNDLIAQVQPRARPQRRRR